MREPRKFPAVLTGVMIVLLFLFGGAGVLSYLAFGSEIQTVVIVNLDSESKLTQAVRICFGSAYSFSHVQCSIYFPLPQYPGTIPLLSSHTSLRPPPALPRRPHHGKWHIHQTKW